MHGRALTAALACAAAVAAPAPARAAAHVHRSLPDSGRIELVLPATQPTTRFRIELRMTLAPGSFFVQLVHARRRPGVTPSLLTASVEEFDGEGAHLGGNDAPVCSPPVSCSITGGGTELVAGVSGKLAAGARVVLVWRGSDASLDVSADGRVRVSAADARYRRVTATAAVAARNVAVQASPVEDVVVADGTAAIASVPCGPPGVATATVWRDARKVADLSCGARSGYAASATPGATSRWTLRGNLTGESAGSARLWTVAID